jgi:beta-galactosidase
VVSFFSGIVDENDRVRLGGYPGAFREMLGVVTDEFYPLGLDDSRALSDGSHATLWSESLRTTTATPIIHYTSGELPGVPAVTRNEFGAGVGWYIATALQPGSLAGLLRRIVDEAGVRGIADTHSGVEIVRRRGTSRDYIFVLNHTDQHVEHCFAGEELLSGTTVTTTATIEPGGVHVIRQERGNE